MRLNNFLKQEGLIIQTPSESEIVERAKTKKLNLFYGETYDHFGNPIDSMKYYLFLSNLKDVLKSEGIDSKAQILIADTAACRNVSYQQQRRYERLGMERARFVEQINEIYNAGLEVIMMSDYIHSQEFRKKREEIMKFCKEDPDLMGQIEKSVPESKVEIEKKKGFMYSFDEITTIIDLDIKIGPPREDLYDKIAREVASRKNQKKLMSLFLTPTYPLNKTWHYFFVHEETEKYGITAYKAGSKKLQDHRIVIGKTTPQEAKRLIELSFISKELSLPNPTLDLYIISELAKQRLNQKIEPITIFKEFYYGDMNPEQLKQLTIEKLEKNIFSKIK